MIFENVWRNDGNFPMHITHPLGIRILNSQSKTIFWNYLIVKSAKQKCDGQTCMSFSAAHLPLPWLSWRHVTLRTELLSWHINTGDLFLGLCFAFMELNACYACIFLFHLFCGEFHVSVRLYSRLGVQYMNTRKQNQKCVIGRNLKLYLLFLF